MRGAQQQLEHGATPADYNNFQGRYAIRHAWTGPIACASPHARPLGRRAAGGNADRRSGHHGRDEPRVRAARQAWQLPNVVAQAVPGDRRRCRACRCRAARAFTTSRDAAARAPMRRRPRASALARRSASLALRPAQEEAEHEDTRSSSRPYSLAVRGARRPHAFCGFYVAGSDQPMFNDATQVVLMRKGTRTVLSMQNNYKGPPQDFAMVDPGAGRAARGRRQDAAEDGVRRRRADERAAARRVLGAGPVRARNDDATTAYAMRRAARDPAGAAMGATRRRLSGHGRGAVRRRRVRDRDPVGEGLDRARRVAARAARTRSRRAPSRCCGRTSRAARSSSSRRSIRSKVQVRRRARRALAAALPLRQRRVHAADPARPRELERHAGSDRQHPRAATSATRSRTTRTSRSRRTSTSRDAVKSKFGAFYAALFDRDASRRTRARSSPSTRGQRGSCDPCPGPTLPPRDARRRSALDVLDAFTPGTASARAMPRTPRRSFK